MLIGLFTQPLQHDGKDIERIRVQFLSRDSICARLHRVEQELAGLHERCRQLVGEMRLWMKFIASRAARSLSDALAPRNPPDRSYSQLRESC